MASDTDASDIESFEKSAEIPNKWLFMQGNGNTGLASELESRSNYLFDNSAAATGGGGGPNDLYHGIDNFLDGG